MDVDFLVQDTYSAIRPQWKLATEPEEATRIFSEAVAQNYKVQDSERPVDPELEDEEAESSSSDDGLEDFAMPEIDDEQEQESSEEGEGEASGPNVDANGESDDESEDEQIVVTRQEEERDPEAEADFDREFEKMMAESMDSRRFERKAVFDIPLPMKRLTRETASSESSPGPVPAPAPAPVPAPVPEAPAAEPAAAPTAPAASGPSKTMAFSLMTKKGNKQQVSIISFPYG